MNGDTKELANQLAGFQIEVRESLVDLDLSIAEIQEQLTEANALLIKVLLQTGLKPEDAITVTLDQISKRGGSDE